MFGISGDGSRPSPKCFFTHVRLPQQTDQKQPPTKKKPFSCILEKHFYHTIDILGPNGLSKCLEAKLQSIVDGHQHAKVQMKLLDLVEGDFFNTYIKQGDLLMLSSGQPGVDNIFTLAAGVLRLNLDRPTYERAGLVGKPIPSPGRKHAKYRFLVEVNLRLPSMVRGRPLHNRLLYAFRNALTDPVTWLVHDLRNPKMRFQGVLAKLEPVLKPLACETRSMPACLWPADLGHLPLDEGLELLSLLLLGSDLTCSTKPASDPLFARYKVPGDTQPLDLMRSKMHGLMSASTITQLLCACVDAAGHDSDEWIVLRAQAFDGRVTTMYIHGGEARIWEHDS